MDNLYDYEARIRIWSMDDAESEVRRLKGQIEAPNMATARIYAPEIIGDTVADRGSDFADWPVERVDVLSLHVTRRL